MNSFLIIIYLIILVAITSFCLIKAKLNIWMRVFLVLVAFWCASAYYFHIDSLRGYASSADFGEASVVAIEIKKPTDDDAGGIYIWAYEQEKERTWIDSLYGINSGYVTPRSFRLDYTKENFRKFENLRQKLKQGSQVKKKKVTKKTEEAKSDTEAYTFVIIKPDVNQKDQ